MAEQRAGRRRQVGRSARRRPGRPGRLTTDGTARREESSKESKKEAREPIEPKRTTNKVELVINYEGSRAGHAARVRRTTRQGRARQQGIMTPLVHSEKH